MVKLLFVAFVFTCVLLQSCVAVECHRCEGYIDLNAEYDADKVVCFESHTKSITASNYCIVERYGNGTGEYMVVWRRSASSLESYELNKWETNTDPDSPNWNVNEIYYCNTDFCNNVTVKAVEWTTPKPSTTTTLAPIIEALPAKGAIAIDEVVNVTEVTNATEVSKASQESAPVQKGQAADWWIWSLIGVIGVLVVQVALSIVVYSIYKHCMKTKPAAGQASSTTLVDVKSKSGLPTPAHSVPHTASLPITSPKTPGHNTPQNVPAVQPLSIDATGTKSQVSPSALASSHMPASSIAPNVTSVTAPIQAASTQVGVPLKLDKVAAKMEPKTSADGKSKRDKKEVKSLSKTQVDDKSQADSSRDNSTSKSQKSTRGKTEISNDE